MYINSRVAARCSMAIEKDAIFFRNCNIIDYSLIVFKINWIKYTIDNDCDMDQVFKKFNSDLNIIPSEKEPGIYYHIGIIDYL